ncbi:hypothetical protein DI487_00735 [Flavobacterium sediminis]|uniref:DUF4843 domain-containing protein n=1 Tax=Flavobacterium sediminis TaxID=2201181 RepID=A0A2U8QR20_9FLAO|nr:hypothetical protein [Flavobacterium sediminis]AWM12539.1 hypothetical protein DI487_00735 [Flavobacterium sediminis]
MKKVILFAFLILSSLSFTSCNKDDDNTKENYAKLNDESYSLKTSLYYTDTNNDGTYESILFIYSEGITYDEVNDEFTGQGSLAVIEMDSHPTQDFSGNYTQTDDVYIVFFPLYDFDNLGNGRAPAPENYVLDTFSLSIAKNGDSATINVSGESTDTPALPFEMYYNGNLTFSPID